MLSLNLPIVYQEARGWNEDISCCASLGALVGMLSTVVYMIIHHSRHNKVAKRRKDRRATSEDRPATSEDRFPSAMVVSLLIPIEMFSFAWKNYPSIHWTVTIMAAAQFKFGIVLVFISTFNYLIDSYTINVSSVLAVNAFLRSIYGAPFPLFMTQMCHNLDIHSPSYTQHF